MALRRRRSSIPTSSDVDVDAQLLMPDAPPPPVSRRRRRSATEGSESPDKMDNGGDEDPDVTEPPTSRPRHHHRVPFHSDTNGNEGTPTMTGSDPDQTGNGNSDGVPESETTAAYDDKSELRNTRESTMDWTATEPESEDPYQPVATPRRPLRSSRTRTPTPGEGVPVEGLRFSSVTLTREALTSVSVTETMEEPSTVTTTTVRAEDSPVPPPHGGESPPPEVPTEGPGGAPGGRTESVAPSGGPRAGLGGNNLEVTGGPGVGSGGTSEGGGGSSPPGNDNVPAGRGTSSSPTTNQPRVRVPVATGESDDVTSDDVASDDVAAGTGGVNVTRTDRTTEPRHSTGPRPPTSLDTPGDTTTETVTATALVGESGISDAPTELADTSPVTSEGVNTSPVTSPPAMRSEGGDTSHVTAEGTNTSPVTSPRVVTSGGAVTSPPAGTSNREDLAPATPVVTSGSTATTTDINLPTEASASEGIDTSPVTSPPVVTSSVTSDENNTPDLTPSSPDRPHTRSMTRAERHDDPSDTTTTSSTTSPTITATTPSSTTATTSSSTTTTVTTSTDVEMSPGEPTVDVTAEAHTEREGHEGEGHSVAEGHSDGEGHTAGEGHMEVEGQPDSEGHMEVEGHVDSEGHAEGEGHTEGEINTEGEGHTQPEGHIPGEGHTDTEGHIAENGHNEGEGHMETEGDNTEGHTEPEGHSMEEGHTEGEGHSGDESDSGSGDPEVVVPEEEPSWASGVTPWGETFPRPHRRRDRIEPPAPAPRPRPTPAPGPGGRDPEDPKPDPTPVDPTPAPAPPPPGDTSIDEVDPPEELGNLKFLNLKLLETSNRFIHKTDRYSNKGLIVRRGWGFKVKVILSDTFKDDSDCIILKFLKSSKPEFSKRTCVLLKSDKSEKAFMNQSWKMDVAKKDDKEVTFEITPDADGLTGEFSIVVETQRKKSEGDIQVSRKVAGEVIVLFNAFNKDDEVYMEDDKEREEYVMNETGLIYNNVDLFYKGKRRWNFGQFEENVLEAALWILDNGYLKKHLSGNAVQVTRALSAQVNDEVLIGNWSGKYEDGVSPTKWNGSVKILQQFFDSKSAVKYGQCWVFSGVLTTVSRALGIPCRSVTNNASAHDTDVSNTIDHYSNEEGEPIEWRNNDSVWNFHVWNECWMKRQDLPSGYDGWQAFDSTPQEASDGRFRCGPCPVTAIYKGQVDVMYDAPFIFSEVNADRVYWKVLADGTPTVYNIRTDAVGKYISTKCVGSDEREDVTDKYKPPEGSSKERTNAINAMRRGHMWDEMSKEFDKYKEHVQDVAFEMEECRISPHGDCKTWVKITNNSDKERTVIGKINMLASYNVGPARKKLHKPYLVDLKLPAGQSETVQWEVKAEDYFSNLDDDAMVQICAVLSVKGTDQTWSALENLPIEKPDLEVKVDKEEVEIGEEFEVTLKFENPLGVPIKGIDVDLEGSGMDKKMDVKLESTMLKPGATLKTSVKLKAKRPGSKLIIASFDGDVLQGITGAVHILVKGEVPESDDGDE